MDEPRNKASNKPKSEASGSHWSKDYVEHLRTIHFSLIALSLAAIVLASAASPNEITQARKQINAILEVVRKWDEGWLKLGVERTLARYASEKRKAISLTFEETTRYEPHPNDANRMTIAWPAGPQSYEFRFRGPNWIVEGPLRNFLEEHKDLADPKVGNDGPAPFVLTPTKLIQFREIWDVLNENHVIEVPELLMTSAYSATEDYPPPGVPAKWTITKVGLKWEKLENASVSQNSPADLDLVPIPRFLRQYLPSDSRKYAYETYPGGIRQEIILIIPVDHSLAVDFDAQNVLIEQFNAEKPPAGSFEHSFPELSRITKNYQSVEIDQFDPILEAEEGRTAESLEAFGVKFPAEATTRWGVFVILGVQLYFWIHLYELARKLAPDDAGWEVAYIGMYRSFPSRVVYSISILAIPVGAVVALGIRGLYVGHKSWMYWLYLIVGTLLSLSLAFATLRAAPNRPAETVVTHT